uniref:Uncharacterized protein n=1 Tax=Tetraselmis chuii TaxID=63592 RepID=A0A7S1X4M1_9CHLO|mmetsp:Transcript_30481/g.54615  ORF Transcript_30481/g.54615 Transcript_30481/m.54615 type:complete len:251 (+) Transcript_30481:217-969(+)
MPHAMKRKGGEREASTLNIWQRLLIVTVLTAGLAKWQVYFMHRRVEQLHRDSSSTITPPTHVQQDATQKVALSRTTHRHESTPNRNQTAGTAAGARSSTEGEGSPRYVEDDKGKRNFFFPDTYDAAWRPERTKLGDVNFLLTTEQFYMDGAPGNGSSSRAVLTYPLWNKSADADGANRYGLAAKIAEELGIGVYKFPSSIVRTLPTRPPKLRYRSCAVVGNSGEMLHGALGQEIDAHDVVIRMNGAPTKV